MINWKTRFRNKGFWLAIIPAVAVAVQVVLQPLGIGFDTDGAVSWALALVNAVFSVLAILGVVADPTTEGVGDSERALGYDEPAPSARHMGGGGQ